MALPIRYLCGIALDISSKVLNELTALCFMLVDDLTNGVVEKWRFPVDADRHTVLQPANLLLDRLDNTQILVGIHQHGVFAFVSSRNMPWPPTSTSRQVASKSSVYYGSVTSPGRSVKSIRRCILSAKSPPQIRYISRRLALSIPISRSYSS